MVSNENAREYLKRIAKAKDGTKLDEIVEQASYDDTIMHHDYWVIYETALEKYHAIYD